MSGYRYLILKNSFVVLITSIIFMAGFSTYVFAEEIVIQKSSLSTNDHHFSSMIRTQTVSDDGSIWIFITTTEPAEKEQMIINMRFTDKDGGQVYDINYDIIATQNGKVVLEDVMVNQQMGIADHRTQALLSDDNVNLRITLQGIGTDSPFTGPQGETDSVKEVPEFGMISIMILTVAILSIIGISAKSRVMIH